MYEIERMLKDYSDNPVIVSTHPQGDYDDGVTKEWVMELVDVDITQFLVKTEDEDKPVHGGEQAYCDDFEDTDKSGGRPGYLSRTDAMKILDEGDFIWFSGGFVQPSYCLSETYRSIRENHFGEEDVESGIIVEPTYTAPHVAEPNNPEIRDKGPRTLAEEIQKEESKIYREGTGVLLNAFDWDRTNLTSLGTVERENLREVENHFKGLQRMQDAIDTILDEGLVASRWDTRFSMGQLEDDEVIPRTDLEDAVVYFTPMSDELFFSRYRLTEPENSRKSQGELHGYGGVYPPHGFMPPEGFIHDNLFFLETGGHFKISVWYRPDTDEFEVGEFKAGETEGDKDVIASLLESDTKARAQVK
jgi:hypothetical protein